WGSTPQQHAQAQRSRPAARAQRVRADPLQPRGKGRRDKAAPNRTTWQGRTGSSGPAPPPRQPPGESKNINRKAKRGENTMAKAKTNTEIIRDSVQHIFSREQIHTLAAAHFSAETIAAHASGIIVLDKDGNELDPTPDAELILVSGLFHT